MTFVQSTSINPYVPYTGGYCERYAENTVGLSGVFPRAIDGWNSNTGNHPGEQPPKGVMVPVYFTLANVPAGHVAISLGDGRVASSTQGGYHTTPYIHPSLQDLINVYSNPAYGNGKCTYLGWSEYIGRKQVVKGGSMAIIQNTENWYQRCNKEHIWFRDEQLDRAIFAKFVGQDYLKFSEAVQDDPKADVVRKWTLTGKTATQDNWPGQIYALQDQVKTLLAGGTIDQAAIDKVIKEAQEALDAAKVLKT